MSHRYRENGRDDIKLSTILDDSTWTAFPEAPTTPGENPFDENHALVTFVDRMLSPGSLTGRDRRILMWDDALRAWATVLNSMAVRVKVAYATGHADTHTLDALRNQTLQALAAVTHPDQRRAGSPLDQLLSQLDQAIEVDKPTGDKPLARLIAQQQDKARRQLEKRMAPKP